MKKGLVRTNRLLLLGGLFIGVFLAFCWNGPAPVQAAAGVNQTMNFQGRLLNSQGATVPDGFYNIQFKIYQDGDGQSVGNPSGTLEWTEDYLNDDGNGVRVVNGYLSVKLGSINPFGSSIDWNQDTLWLSMNIGDTSPSCTPFANCSPDGEMVPMQRLTSAPYALNSGQLGGLTSAQFVQLAQGVQTDASSNSSIYINKTGAGNLIQLQASGTDVFSVDTTGNTVNIGVTGSTNANSTIHIADSTAGVQTVTIGSTNSTSGTILQAGTLGITLSGNTTLSGASTFTTGTGSVALNGDTAIANDKSLTVNGNAAFRTNTNSVNAFQIQNSSYATLLNVDNSALNLAVNGGAETSGSFSTDWTAMGTATIARTTTSGQFISGVAAVSANPTAATSGVKNNLGTALSTNTTYLVSFSAKLASGSMTDLSVRYDRTTDTQDAVCSNYSTQTIDSTDWYRVNCAFTTTGTAGTAAASVNIYQAGSANRTIYIDNLNVTAQNTSGVLNVNQVKVGGTAGQGLTLFSVDSFASAPNTNATINPALYGSMYFDTTIGKLRCYNSDGWGGCGGSTTAVVTLIPEYTGAVLNGTGVGTLTTNFCSNDTALQVNTGLCASGTSRQYYEWTTPQATQQTYSIYLSYKLPDTFSAFEDSNTIKLTARTDHTTNGVVDYQVFRSTGSAVTSCGSQTDVASSSANTWHTVSFSGDETACGFAGGDSVLFKINVRANSNANVYVENISFTHLNN